jgi:PhnB protein
MAVKPIPDGYHTVTPYLIVDDAQKLINFLKQAFDAKETFCMRGQGEKIMHAEVEIGDSTIMISDAT